MRTIGQAGKFIVALCFTLSSAFSDPSAEDIFGQLVENWSWSQYWFGRSSLSGIYSPGKETTMLVFWTKTGRRVKTGMCSLDVGLCVAYSGPYLNPRGESAPITRMATLEGAFVSFIDSGFNGAESYMPSRDRLREVDFYHKVIKVILPRIDVPSSISNRVIPSGARQEAERAKSIIGGCHHSAKGAAPERCSGELVFAYCGPKDPYWFVLRTCSAKCGDTTDSIQELTRGDYGWEATSSGYIESPKQTVAHLKAQIEDAAMFRLKL